MKIKLIAGISIIMLAFIMVVTGCTPKKETSPPPKEFGLSNVVFCTEEPAGYMNYKEQPEATYKPGDIVWIYLNVDNLKYNPNEEGTNEVWLSEYLTLKDPNGKVLLDQELLNEHSNLPKTLDPNTMFLKNRILTTKNLPEGKYTVYLKVTDKLANKTATTSSNFYLKK